MGFRDFRQANLFYLHFPIRDPAVFNARSNSVNLDPESDPTNCASCALRTLAPVDAVDALRVHSWFSLVFEVLVAKHVFSFTSVSPT